MFERSTAALQVASSIVRDLSGFRLGRSTSPDASWPFRSYAPKDEQPGLPYIHAELDALHRIIMARSVVHSATLFSDLALRTHDNALAKLCEHGREVRASEMPTVQFDELEDGEFYERFAEEGRPVVIKGMRSEGIDTWNTEWFFERFGSREELLLNRQKRRYEPHPLSALKTNRHLYYANSSVLTSEDPSLLEEVGVPTLREMLPNHTLRSAQFFVSAFTSKATPLHGGYVAFTYMNLAGRKRWQVIDPAYFGLCYGFVFPFDIRSAVGFVDDNRRALLPLLRYCPHYEVILEPGDVLWVPKYWLHSVDNLSETNLGLSVRWLPNFHFVSDPCPFITQTLPLLLYRRLPILYNDALAKLLEARYDLYDIVAHGRAPQVEIPLEDMARGWGVRIVDGDVSSRWNSESVPFSALL